MLILSRRVDESLRIGDDIHITVLGVNGKQVQIGITAPDDVPVHREEIYQRIQRKEPRKLLPVKPDASGRKAS